MKSKFTGVSFKTKYGKYGPIYTILENGSVCSKGFQSTRMWSDSEISKLFKEKTWVEVNKLDLSDVRSNKNV